MRVLAGPVHIGVAQNSVIQPVSLVEQVQVQLAGVLGKGVGGEGAYRGLLIAGDGRRVAVDGAAGGGKDNLVHALVSGGGGDADGAEHIGVGVGHRVGGGLPDAALRRQVEYDFRPFPLDNLGNPGVVDAGVVESGGVVEAAQVAGGQVVHHHHGIAVAQQGVHQVGADEAGAAGNQGFDGFGQKRNASRWPLLCH